MPEPVWSRLPDLAVVARPGRVTVLDLSRREATQPLVMEGPAEAVWRALDTPRTAQDVVAHVAADFGLPASEVAADVVAFLDELHRRGLVERQEPAPGVT